MIRTEIETRQVEILVLREGGGREEEKGYTVLNDTEIETSQLQDNINSRQRRWGGREMEGVE